MSLGSWLFRGNFILSLRNLMKTLTPLKTIAILCVLILAAACGGKTETIRPEVRDITASVYASATVQPDNMYRVHAAVSGILDSNLVEEGDLVGSGAPLIHITDQTPRLSSENARLQKGCNGRPVSDLPDRKYP